MKKRKINKKIKKEIPLEIKVLFGKFYFFSILLNIILLLFLPFAIKRVSFVFGLSCFILFLMLYIFIIIDFLKKRQHFMSNFVGIIIIFTFFSFSLLFVRLIGLA